MLEYVELSERTLAKLRDFIYDNVEDDGLALKIIDYFESMTPADVVPVVRCKDCSKRKTGECPMCEEIDPIEVYDWTLDEGFCDEWLAKRGENHAD